MDKQKHFFGRNLRKYSLLQFNAYDLLTSCEKPEDGYRLLLRKFVYIHRQMDRWIDGSTGSKDLLRFPLCSDINKTKPFLSHAFQKVRLK